MLCNNTHPDLRDHVTCPHCGRIYCQECIDEARKAGKHDCPYCDQILIEDGRKEIHKEKTIEEFKPTKTTVETQLKDKEPDLDKKFELDHEPYSISKNISKPISVFEPKPSLQTEVEPYSLSDPKIIRLSFKGRHPDFFNILIWVIASHFTLLLFTTIVVWIGVFPLVFFVSVYYLGLLWNWGEWDKMSTKGRYYFFGVWSTAGAIAFYVLYALLGILLTL